MFVYAWQFGYELKLDLNNPLSPADYYQKCLGDSWVPGTVGPMVPYLSYRASICLTINSKTYGVYLDVFGHGRQKKCSLFVLSGNFVIIYKGKILTSYHKM